MTLFNIPDTIDKTGLSDVSSQLTDFINSLPESASVNFPVEGIYRVDMPIRVIGKVGLRLFGRNSRFVQGPEPVGLDRLALRSRFVWSFKECFKTEIMQMHIVGANPYAGMHSKAYDSTREAQHAIDLAGCEKMTISDLTTSQTWGDGIYVGPSIVQGALIPCRETLIQRCSIWGSGRQGIAITHANDTTIDWCAFDSARRTVIDIEPTASHWTVKRTNIKNCVVGSWRLGCVGINGSSGTIEDVLVEKCKGKRFLVRVVRNDLQRRKNISVINCETGPGNDAMVVSRTVDGLTVVGNKQPLIPRLTNPSGCVISYTCAIDISGNDWGPGIEQYWDKTPTFCADQVNPPVPSPTPVPPSGGGNIGSSSGLFNG